MKELLIGVLNFFGLAVWIKVTTDNPRCVYFFGPFLTMKGAREEENGYLEDLLGEGARGIKTEIKRFKPSELTIFDDLADVDNAPQEISRMTSQPSLYL
ncbi:MAG: DUF1816 domain-containing protein [Cyanobacterium sp. T60_A2020_053]|nr:DUF1816 domain-containing protein [Cyanobacterium sp. T60_A2020_053]